MIPYLRPKETKPRQRQARLKKPARKPRNQQWSTKNQFICGKCKSTFTTRYA